MSELDFSRESVPHKKGERKYFRPSDEEAFSRMTIAPLLADLSEKNRKILDQVIVDTFWGSEVESSARTTHEIIRRLSIHDLESVAETIEAIKIRYGQ